MGFILGMFITGQRFPQQLNHVNGKELPLHLHKNTYYSIPLIIKSLVCNLVKNFILILGTAKQPFSNCSALISLLRCQVAFGRKQKDAQRGKSDFQGNSCIIQQEQPPVQAPNGKHRQAKFMALLLGHLSCSFAEILIARSHSSTFNWINFPSPSRRLLRHIFCLSLLDSAAVSNSKKTLVRTNRFSTILLPQP